MIQGETLIAVSSGFPVLASSMMIVLVSQPGTTCTDLVPVPRLHAFIRMSEHECRAFVCACVRLKFYAIYPR